MAVDRVIIPGIGEAVSDTGFQLEDSLKGLVQRSINTPKGALFFNPDFGSLLHTISKVSGDSVLLAGQYAEHACRWIIASGKASRITASGSIDSRNKSRINIDVSVVLPDGKTDRYAVWYTVI